MAVRTPFVGIKNRRLARTYGAQQGPQSTHGRGTPFREELVEQRRERLLGRAHLGPASVVHKPKRPRTEAPVRGRKKPPGQMHVKRDGG
jgi:hypothetical protein